MLGEMGEINQLRPCGADLYDSMLCTRDARWYFGVHVELDDWTFDS